MSVRLVFIEACLFCLGCAFLTVGCATRVKHYSARGPARVILDNRGKRFRSYPRNETPIRVVLDTGRGMLCGTGTRPGEPCIAVDGLAVSERVSSASREMSRAGRRDGLLLEDFGLLVRDFFEAHLKQRYGNVSVAIGRPRPGDETIVVKPRLILPDPRDRSRPVLVLTVILPSGQSLTVQDDTMNSSVAEYLTTGASIDELTRATEGTLLPIVITSVDRAVLRAVVEIEQQQKAPYPSGIDATTDGTQHRSGAAQARAVALDPIAPAPGRLRRETSVRYSRADAGR
jgi:hypothetical protein